ncbi:MAG TPA: GGDEF domain-containing protein [Phycisphaerales bacterium]|nr:GGDEF domain-containing protein [Phycisphaerales bacterium]
MSAVIFSPSFTSDPQLASQIRAIRTLDPTVQIVLLGSHTRSLSSAMSSQQPHLRGPDVILSLPISPEILDILAAGDDLASSLSSHADIIHTTEPGFMNIEGVVASGGLPTAPSVSQFTERAARPMPAARSAPSVSSLISSIAGRKPSHVATLSTSSASLHQAAVNDGSSSSPPPLPQPPADFPPAATVPTASSHFAQTVASLDSTDSLGDTDLIAALLDEPPHLLETALKLIIQQSRWTDLVFLPDPATPGPSQLYAPVELAGNRFGMLASSLASSRQLAPWGQWLAHWLNLDRAHQQQREWALKDELTGAYNRRYYNLFLKNEIAVASAARRSITVMVFDLDNFKQFNDDYGHEAGDLILVETVKLLHSVIRQTDRVCRIGGDEFAVIFNDPQGPREVGSAHPTAVEAIASRFQQQICQMKFPKLGAEAPGIITISAGMATYPWDGTDPASLLRHADSLALESKRNGKNAITFGPKNHR